MFYQSFACKLSIFSIFFLAVILITCRWRLRMRLLLQPTRVLKMHLLSRIQSRFDIFDFNPLILAPNLVTSSRSLFVVPFGMLQIWQAGEWCEKVTVLNLLNLNNVNLRLFGWPGFESGHDFAVSCLATHAARYRLTGLPLDFRAAHFVVVFVWFFFSRMELKKTKQPYIQLYGNHEFHEFILPFSFYDFNEKTIFFFDLYCFTHDHKTPPK